MPDRIAVSGVEFVEFAATTETAPALVRFFHGMGFRQGRPPRLQGRDPLPPGRHQPRRQHRARGLRPLRLPDPRRRRLRHRPPRRGRRRHRRARRRPRRPDSSSSRIGPGELAIPAIRGVGGAVMHFLDQSPALARVWETEFVPAEDDVPVADTGLLAVDHLAQTMPYDEMLSWLLFYTTIFRTREGADRRHHRPLGRRPQPGDRERRRLAAPDAQRRREHPHLRRPLHRRVVRLRRPAPRLRHAATSSPPPPPSPPTASRRWRSRRTTSTTSRPASASTPTSPTGCRPRTSSTTATSTASISSSTARTSARASSSRSSSAAAATAATAPRTPRSASPPRSATCARRACRGPDR